MEYIPWSIVFTERSGNIHVMPKNPSTIRRGRPRSDAAEAHAAIMDAVYELLRETSARDLTMEAVAKRAKVGKPTLYKWWPTKPALIMAMFHERVSRQLELVEASTAEEELRGRVRTLIGEFNGLFGKFFADLIAEGQNDPAVLRELYDKHIAERRASTAATIERGKAAGEFAADTDAILLIDAIFGPIYFRLLVKFAPLTQEYGSALIDQVLRGVRRRAD
jgi:AcrR family transcriptional regulator